MPMVDAEQPQSKSAVYRLTIETSINGQFTVGEETEGVVTMSELTAEQVYDLVVRYLEDNA